MKQTELNLLHRYLAGTIGPEDMPALENLLLTSAEARRTLRSLATIDAKFQQLASGPIPAPEPPRPRFSISPWLSLTAISLALMIGAFGWLYPGSEMENSLARVIRCEGTDQKFAEGQKLHAGESINMENGLIEMAFHETGVHVIATGRLKLKIDTSKRVFLEEGEVKLHVPPQGIGFVVETLDRKITDLGTSFVVTTRNQDSQVLVLDGQIAVADRDGGAERQMNQGELANFNRNGALKLHANQHSGVPERSVPSQSANSSSLNGVIFGFPDLSVFPGNRPPTGDLIGPRVMPLISSGFTDRTCLEKLKLGSPLRFNGVAGTYNRFPDHTGLPPFERKTGWLAWYHGRVKAPSPGRYRFWGYADNQLLVAINGKPIFDGSRYDSAFRDLLRVPRIDNPSWPCLNAPAGFAAGPWVDIGTDAIQLDVIFGETAGSMTSALLLFEREGVSHETTFWGQPKWPLFLTELPDETAKAELDNLRISMEEKLMGSFSISNDAIWRVESF